MSECPQCGWVGCEECLPEYYDEIREQNYSLRADVARLEAENARLKNSLNGFGWLLDEGALVRDISRDGEADYTIRSLKFVMWLRAALAPADTAEETE